MTTKSSQKKPTKKTTRRVRVNKLDLEPMSQTKMEKIFVEYEVVFMETQISATEEELVKKINTILNVLDLGDDLIPITKDNRDSRFLTWTGEKLISAMERLARFSEPLGEFISKHESRSDFAYIWRKGAYARDWLPVKAELKNTFDRVTNSEVDSALTEKYLNEQFYSMFHRRRSDFLIRKLDAINKMTRTIDHRLRELGRQYSLPQDGGHTGK